MIKNCLIYFIFIVCGAFAPLQAMVFDNRFFPLYLKPYIRRIEAPSHFRIQSFFMGGDRAQGDFEEAEIPDIDGKYDLVQIGKALVDSGRLAENPFRSDLQGISSIPFKREGRIDGRGLAFLYEQAFGCYVSMGLDFFFMNVNARHDFCLDSSCIDVQPGDKQYLLGLKERMHQDLGILPPLYSRTSFSDVDLYLRLGGSWQYMYKCRRIDAGLKFGAIIPSSPKIPINNPTAIPIGGQKHWGAYIDLQNEFELREDLFAGLMFRASKRFARTECARMPVALEPSKYGAVIGSLDVNPGWTFVFNPSVTLEGLREGFGVKLLYTLVDHLEDKLQDKRDDKTIAVNLDPVQKRSSWGMEHVTIGAFYDFAKSRDCPSRLPAISLYWDIPVDWLVSKRSVKAQAVSIMFDLDF